MFNRSYIEIRKDLIGNITGTGLTILDLGCATGVNGQFLLENNIAKTVYGVDYDEDMAEIAKNNNSEVFIGNLNDDEFTNHILLNINSLDVIICGDILEHLYNPSKVLKQLTTKLKKDGKVIISLPNIQHWELFIQIYLKGSWPKNERGIFDKTHLRWFTRKDTYALANDSGLKVEKYIRKLRARDQLGSKFKWYTKILRFINKDWVTFQHTIICKHA